MPTIDEKRETGAALIVAGCLAWFFEFLVVFFLPAAWRQGHHAGFFAAMAGLAAVGLVLVMLGFRDRREADAK